jgi:hypothetical protein
MALKSLVAASITAIVAGIPQASARAPAPLVPTALVEDVKSATADVEFMDYVGSGQTIKLAPGEVLVLSYLKSCEHETITGGTVVVGTERSTIKDGQVVRAKVACNGGKMQVSAQQANNSATSAFRLQSADVLPKLYGRTPVVQLPKGLAGDERTLLLVRTDRPGERHWLKLDDASAVNGLFDLAKNKLVLTPGATYQASVGDHKMAFQIDKQAKSGPLPVVSRLLRLQ